MSKKKIIENIKDWTRYSSDIPGLNKLSLDQLNAINSALDEVYDAGNRHGNEEAREVFEQEQQDEVHARNIAIGPRPDNVILFRNVG